MGHIISTKLIQKLINYEESVINQKQCFKGQNITKFITDYLKHYSKNAKNAKDNLTSKLTNFHEYKRKNGKTES